jgi:hypothetical protein
MRLALIALVALSCWSCGDGFVGEFSLAGGSRADALRPDGAQAAAPAVSKPLSQDPDAEKQRRTVADIRNLGTALFSWLTDQIGAAAAGKRQIQDLDLYPIITADNLESLLVPTYMSAVPKTDGWGHKLEVRLNVDNFLAERVMSIRSPGRDGESPSNIYQIESFDPNDYDQDIVWTDGFFVRWPAQTPD